MEDCADEIDNDQDGLTDCDDEDCVCVEEDCYDGVDDDADGLLDCEDDDCVDICIEDCADDFDNDVDGQIDCADDECFGVGDCGGPYRMLTEMKIPFLAWAAGDLTGFGDSSEGFAYSYNVAIYTNGGQVNVSGIPDGWSGPEISCFGYLQGGFDLVNLKGYPDMFSYIGAATGVDYAMGFQPRTANGSLTWSGSCPVAALSYETLGVTRGVPYVYSMQGGSWVVQYSSGYYSGYDARPKQDISLDVMSSVSQSKPVRWRAFY